MTSTIFKGQLCGKMRGSQEPHSTFFGPFRKIENLAYLLRSFMNSVQRTKLMA